MLSDSKYEGILSVPLPRACRPRSGRALSRAKDAARPSRLRRLVRFRLRSLTRPRGTDWSAHSIGRAHLQAFRSTRSRSIPPLSAHGRPGATTDVRIIAHLCGARGVSPPIAISSSPSSGRPSPPTNVRRCGSRRLRGNPPKGGSSTPLRPCATQASLGCLRLQATAIPRTPAGE
jgi:hypothetical protein